MSRVHRLATRELAAWWRDRHLPVLYPIDLGAEATYDVVVPDDVPALRLLQRVATAARLSIFTLHVSPQQVLRCAVAVTGGDEAVLVDVTGDKAQLSQLGTSDGVRAIADLLPDLAPANVPDTELSEADWSAIVALLASDADEAARRTRLHSRGLPDRLAAAMIAGAAEPLTVGTVGVQVFTDEGAQLGPSLVSWQELPGGALLTHVHAPRRPGLAAVELGAYRRDAIVRALTEAVSTALYRVRR